MSELRVRAVSLTEEHTKELEKAQYFSKHRSRIMPWDILEWYPNGTITDVISPNSKDYFIFCPQMPDSLAKSITCQWYRSFNILKIVDEVDYQEYQITLTNNSVSGKELFSAEETFLKLKSDVSLIDRMSNRIIIRHTPDKTATEVDKIIIANDRKENFEDIIKKEIIELNIPIARAKYYIDIDNLPQSNIDDLLVNRKTTIQLSYLQPCIVDKTKVTLSVMEAIK